MNLKVLLFYIFKHENMVETRNDSSTNNHLIYPKVEYIFNEDIVPLIQNWMNARLNI